MVKMKIEDKILEEIARYKSINNYIIEQADLGAPPVPGEEPPLGGEPPLPGGEPPLPGGPPAPGAPPAGGAPPAPTGTTEVDIETDADVEEIGTEEGGGEEEGGEEELDITDLVDTQKSMSDKQEEYFNNLFTQLSTLENKLGDFYQALNWGTIPKNDNIADFFSF